MQQCKICLITKPLKDFHKSKRCASGHRYQCKSCRSSWKKEWYSSWNEEKKEKTKKQYAACHKRNRDYIYNYLKSKQCIDCGEARWQVLEFDHVSGTKEYEISDMIRHRMAISRIETEILKCEIRCANCHRMKTAVQLGWDKAKDCSKAYPYDEILSHA